MHNGRFSAPTRRKTIKTVFRCARVFVGINCGLAKKLADVSFVIYSSDVSLFEIYFIADMMSTIGLLSTSTIINMSTSTVINMCK